MSIVTDADLTSEYISVKIILRRENQEVVYDLPKVENFMVESKYEEPDILSIYPRISKAPKIESFTVSMKPLMEDGKLYTITTTNYGVPVDE